MPDNATGDRRPIASRELLIWQHAAAVLARAGVSPNLISVLGLAAALLGSAFLALTPYTSGLHTRFHFLVAAVLIQLRLLANMLDGMVAVAANKASPRGELFNEIPDRLSDTALLVTAGYALGGQPALGWAAAVVALFVTYLRAFGKSVGVAGLFHGPMSKSHRMFALTVGCVSLAVIPSKYSSFELRGTHEQIGLMSWVLIVVILGGIVTAYRRLARISAAL